MRLEETIKEVVKYDCFICGDSLSPIYTLWGAGPQQEVPPEALSTVYIISKKHL